MVDRCRVVNAINNNASRCLGDSSVPSRIELASFSFNKHTVACTRARARERANERTTSYHIRLGRPISVIILPVSLLVRTHANASFSTLAKKKKKKRRRNHVSSRCECLKPFQAEISRAESFCHEEINDDTRTCFAILPG